MKYLLFILLCTNILFAQKYKSFEKDGKWGFKNRNTGKEIIPCKYESAYFHNNFFHVFLNKKFGIIDSRDSLITPIIYDTLKYDFVDNSSDYGFSRVKLNNKWGFVNSKGKEITPFKYDSVDNFNKINACI